MEKNEFCSYKMEKDVQEGEGGVSQRWGSHGV